MIPASTISTIFSALASATDVRPLEEVERDYIKSVLRAVGGNRSQAAQKFGIGAATLYRKIKQFGDG